MHLLLVATANNLFAWIDAIMLMHLLRQVMFWEFYALLATYPGKGPARMLSTYPQIFGRKFMT